MTRSDRDIYKQYENLPIWQILSHAIHDLVDNGNMEERTAHEYIVGYLCERLIEAGKRKAKS